jgi:hypothetical protein
MVLLSNYKKVTTTTTTEKATTNQASFEEYRGRISTTS